PLITNEFIMGHHPRKMGSAPRRAFLGVYAAVPTPLARCKFGSADDLREGLDIVEFLNSLPIRQGGHSGLNPFQPFKNQLQFAHCSPCPFFGTHKPSWIPRRSRYRASAAARRCKWRR